VRPLGRRAASLLGALAFLAVIVSVLAGGSWRGDFRIDEAHKISESAFLRLWLRGDVRNPAWFANIIDRTNPPAGKYAFGAAILLTGHALPPLPTLAVRGGMPPLYPEALSAPYRPFLTAARSVSAVATALTAALLAMMLARYHGWLSAAAGVAFFALSFLTRSSWAAALFDPLLALFFMLTVALTTTLVRATSTKRIAAIAAAIGIVTALAFQTRLNGLFALLIALPFLWIILRRTPRTSIVATTVVAAAFIATTLALNPYYWSAPRIPLEPFSSQRGPLRPIERLVRQKHDLAIVAAPLQRARMEGRTLGEKFVYLCQAVMEDMAGLLMTIAAAAGIVLLAARFRSFTPPLRIALPMSIAVIVTMVATLPLPWSRYLLVALPPLALLAGFATGEGVSMLSGQWRRARPPA
jgi:hypothetical protein